MVDNCSRCAIAYVVLVCSLSSCQAAVQGRASDQKLISQTSIPYDRWRTGGDPLAKLPFDDPRLADMSGGLNPSQVPCHVAESFVLQLVRILL